MIGWVDYYLKYVICFIVKDDKNARTYIMSIININLMERYLLLLDRFVDKLVESGFAEKEITEKSYLFCAGFYIKYKDDIEKLTFSNREVVLTFLLLSYYSYINKLDDDLLDKMAKKKKVRPIVFVKKPLVFTKG